MDAAGKRCAAVFDEHGGCDEEGTCVECRAHQDDRYSCRMSTMKHREFLTGSALALVDVTTRGSAA
jgi:hypothetical protein